MTKQFTRTRMTYIAYVLIALYGYFLNILGPITPFLHAEFQLSYTVSSLHFSAFASGILVVGLAGQFVIHRLGRKQALAVGAIGLGLGALLLVLGRAPTITVAATFLMGCVGSLILAIVPIALSEEHGQMRAVAISEANVLSSLVATTGPFLVGWLASLLVGWRPALSFAAILSILIGFSLFRLDRAQEIQPDSEQLRGRLSSRFWYYWLALVLAVAVEFCMIYWSADYMEHEFDLQKTSAAQTVSLFLAGMILGRLASSRLLLFLPARKVVIASILLGMLGFLLYWSTANVWVGITGLALTGLGVAGLYPLILSIAIGAAKGQEAQAGARTTLASGMAILVLPLVLGRVADLAGLKAAFGTIPVLFVALFILMAILDPDRKPADLSRRHPI